MTKTVYIAPQVQGLPKLNAKLEAERLRLVVGSDNLSEHIGPLTLDDLCEILRTPCDAVVIAAHGAPGRIFFTGGEATPAWLALQLSHAKPKLVILGTCFSGERSPDNLRNMAEEITAAGVTVAAILREIEDEAAITYSVETLRAIDSGANLRLAHMIALEQMRQVSADAPTHVIHLIGQPQDTLIDAGIILKEIRDLRAAFDTAMLKHAGYGDILGVLSEQAARNEALAETIKTVVSEHGVQQRMLEMLYESQRALMSLTTKLIR